MGFSTFFWSCSGFSGFLVVQGWCFLAWQELETGKVSSEAMRRRRAPRAVEALSPSRLSSSKFSENLSTFYDASGFAPPKQTFIYGLKKLFFPAVPISPNTECAAETF